MKIASWCVFSAVLFVYGWYEIDAILAKGPDIMAHTISAALLWGIGFYGLFQAYLLWKSTHPTPARPRMVILD